jgi:hypothetical protein
MSAIHVSILQSISVRERKRTLQFCNIERISYSKDHDVGFSCHHLIFPDQYLLDDEPQKLLQNIPPPKLHAMQSTWGLILGASKPLRGIVCHDY